MFFDCTGLLAGLAASVITKWKANDKYSYGYVRAEVIAGFVNSLFLLFVAFFIMSEAVERAIEPPEVRYFYHFVVLVNEHEFTDNIIEEDLVLIISYLKVQRLGFLIRLVNN